MTVTLAWADAALERLLSDDAAREAVEAALAHGGRPGAEISVAFVDDAGIAAVHGEWLGDDAPTDVISFDLGEDQDGPMGELYVSVERAAKEAAARGLDPARELALYLVHGTLHLCGYDDREDGERARMRAAEAAVLDGLGYAPAPSVDASE